MTAYVIFLREEPVHDPAAMEKYRNSDKSYVKEFTMKPLAVYGALEALEGPLPDGVVMLEFPTVEEARAWYNSPGYQAAAPHRIKAANYRGFIVEGLPTA
jgi:uncharacterized protein (DUF1330 family)